MMILPLDTSIFLSLVAATVLARPAIPAAIHNDIVQGDVIGIPSGEMGNINGLYGKAFTSTTIILGTGSETYKAHALTAKDGIISLDGKNGNHCPAGAKGCPHKDETGIRVYFNGTADLNAVYNGGQQLYVTPTGRLAYTAPNSSVPRGAFLDKFKMTFTAARNTISGGYHWGFAGDDAAGSKSNGMWACTGGDSRANKGEKGVYAGVPGFDKTKYDHCDQINPGFAPLKHDGPSAYEYA